MPNDVASAPRDPSSHSTGAVQGPDRPLLKDRLLGQAPLPAVEQRELARGEAAWVSAGCPVKAAPNEDATAALPVSAECGLLLVADGLGGHRGGRQASQLLATRLQRLAARRAGLPPAELSGPLYLSRAVAVPHAETSSDRIDMREDLLEQIEGVNRRLLRLRSGAATTLALVELHGRRVRTYHVGDSEILIFSRRGKLKFATVSHSPVGYARESGLLTEEEAIFHPDRHLVSNVVGSDQMSIELGPWIDLSPCDTVLLASDGLFDNVLQAEIIDLLRVGPLPERIRQLAELARQRMTQPQLDRPSKPDDLTILAYREKRRGAPMRGT